MQMVVPLAGLLLFAHAEGRGPPGPGSNGLAVRALPPSFVSRGWGEPHPIPDHSAYLLSFISLR